MRMPSFRSTVQKHIGTGATTETSKLPLLTAVTSLRYDEAEEKIAENYIEPRWKQFEQPEIDRILKEKLLKK